MSQKAPRFSRIDRNTFKDLFQLYYQPLCQLSWHYLQEKEEAKEVVQEAFVKLWELRNDLSPDSNISNFLFTLVKNQCLNILKRRQIRLKHHEKIRWLELHYQYESLSCLTDSYIEYNELKDKLEIAIDKLPQHSRIVYEMSRHQELKNREIADKLGVSQKTVEAHMTKALKILRTELKYYLPVLIGIVELFF